MSCMQAWCAKVGQTGVRAFLRWWLRCSLAALLLGSRGHAMRRSTPTRHANRLRLPSMWACYLGMCRLPAPSGAQAFPSTNGCRTADNGHRHQRARLTPRPQTSPARVAHLPKAVGESAAGLAAVAVVVGRHLPHAAGRHRHRHLERGDLRNGRRSMGHVSIFYLGPCVPHLHLHLRVPQDRACPTCSHGAVLRFAYFCENK